MSMKSLTSPRRLYTRAGSTVVLFDGRFYASPSSEMSLELPVTIEKMKSDGGRSRIQVTQKRKGQESIVETWRSVKLEPKARTAA